MVESTPSMPAVHYRQKTPCAQDKTNRGKEELPLVERCTRNVQAGIKATGNRKGFSLFMPVFPLPDRQKNRHAMQDKEKWSIPEKQEVGQGRRKAPGRLWIPARTDIDKDKKRAVCLKRKRITPGWELSFFPV